jgi:hypothetical protein
MTTMAAPSLRLVQSVAHPSVSGDLRRSLWRQYRDAHRVLLADVPAELHDTAEADLARAAGRLIFGDAAWNFAQAHIAVDTRSPARVAARGADVAEAVSATTSRKRHLPEGDLRGDPPFRRGRATRDRGTARHPQNGLRTAAGGTGAGPVTPNLPEGIAAKIRRSVETAPPLTEEQIATIGAVFARAAETSAAT